jgi:hypothetical protein
MPAEITASDKFGQAIAATVQAFGFTSVLEIGSFDGLGSTRVFIDAMAKLPGPKRLVCLEASPSRWQSLVLNTIDAAWVTPVCGSSISLASLTPQNFDADVWHSPYNGLNYQREVVRGWWEATQRHLSAVRDGFLERCGADFDAVLIDGDEFCGYDDFRLVKDSVQCIMLDDVFHAYKCNRANRELAGAPAWFCVYSDSTVRNGAAIWVRR